MIVNQDYINRLERTIHMARFNLVKADSELKKLNSNNKKLVKENNRLVKVCQFEKEKYLCNICYQNQKDCIIEPCRHFATCSNCSFQLDKCPVCRQKIEKYITLFVS